jgi:hypothetical protein
MRLRTSGYAARGAAQRTVAHPWLILDRSIWSRYHPSRPPQMFAAPQRSLSVSRFFGVFLAIPLHGNSLKLR